MQSLGKCWLIAVALNNLLWVQLTHVLLLRYIQAANLSNEESMRLFLFCIFFSVIIIFYIHVQLVFELLLLFEACT